MDLKDKVVIITGGSDGLGLGAAKRVVELGGRVAICGRDRDRLDRAVDAIAGLGGEVHAQQTDVTDPESLAALFKSVDKKWGKLDGLINGAGYHTGDGFEKTTDQEWQADFELKLFAAIRGCRLAIEMMGDSGGSIINTLSIFAKAPGKSSMPSSVFRGGGLTMTKALANDYGHMNIRVNAILVGFVESDQWVRAAEKNNMDLSEYVASMLKKLDVPLGRIGTALEFGNLAAFLLSSASGYTTGAAIPIDGGLMPAI